MKKLILLLLFIPSIIYSQNTIEYIKILPNEENSFEHREGYFDNVAIFKFNFDIKDFWDTKRCSISGYLQDEEGNKIDDVNKVSIYTGYDNNYLEFEENIPTSDGFFTATVTTKNLPKLLFVVHYNGVKINLSMINVRIRFVNY